jgi:hypothetical protein
VLNINRNSDINQHKKNKIYKNIFFHSTVTATVKRKKLIVKQGRRICNRCLFQLSLSRFSAFKRQIDDFTADRQKHEATSLDWKISVFGKSQCSARAF